MIALGLILIFAIIGVYLHGAASNPATRLLPGLTRDQTAALVLGSIVSIRGIGGGRFDVRIVAPGLEQAALAKQLLTTISSLVGRAASAITVTRS